MTGIFLVCLFAIFKAVNFLKRYFIGGYLSSEHDVIKRTSYELVFYTLILAVSVLCIVSVIYWRNAQYLEVTRTIILLSLFSSALFYLKKFQRIRLITHVLIIVSFTNFLINLVFFFQKFNSVMALVIVINIVMAFQVLGLKAGLFYSVAHFIPALVMAYVQFEYPDLIPYKPRAPGVTEAVVSLSLISCILVFLLYHYQKAFRVATSELSRTLKDLKHSKEMAEEMNRLKTNFLANMSHEIRTPINGILGISQIIEGETHDAEIKNYMQMQRQSGKRLLNTINSILHLSRLEAGKNEMKLHATDINGVVSECIDSLQEMAKSKGLNLIFLPSMKSLSSLSDEFMFHQVISNIIGNAIKFTVTGEIKVSTMLSEAAQTIHIIVEDTGIGISEEFLPRVFNSFEQESSGTTRTHEGSGVGLSISKKYIELLGGDIHVQSVKGKGSTFEVILPAYRA